MKLKTIVDESFEYYRKPVMLLAFPYCTFKCCKEAGLPTTICQNEPWCRQATYDYSEEEVIERYLSNPLTSGLCGGGFEPLDSFGELVSFLEKLRQKTTDVFIVYTGYNFEEKEEETRQLSEFENIIVKYGRYKVGDKPHRDKILGVDLASDNQYAIKIS